jgi:hypothetical protein
MEVLKGYIFLGDKNPTFKTMTSCNGNDKDDTKINVEEQ